MRDIFEKCFEPQMQDLLKEAGIYPYFRALESRQDVEVIMEGKRRIMLGSNNYLGLTVQPEIIEVGIKTIEKYGTGCSGSRFLNGTLQLHYELEDELKKFLRKEDCITFPTGFMSNLGIIAGLVGRHDYVIVDREDHASIYDACRLSYGKMVRYKHADMEDLERVLQTVPDEAGALIVTDGVFSMGGDIAKLPEIVALAKKYGARVMVDDAHGLGILGEGGRGTANYYGLEDDVDIYMGTFSKSLASLGGYMAADERVVDYVRHSARPYMFAASIPPAQTAVALAALRYLEAHPELPEKLQNNAARFRANLKERNVEIIEAPTPIVPIYTYSAENTLVKQKNMYEEGVYVNSVLPPACAPGECLLRTSLMASHTDALIDEASDIIAKVMHHDDSEILAQLKFER
ncbi:MAG: pyridoxal phosphate-dependent aminotransferase family protein [Lachnospiraceae bacterium]|nr:pyridoxal phosphate-dependent aminotransferase family protein [Lachnospiraceae bacterium]